MLKFLPSIAAARVIFSRSCLDLSEVAVENFDRSRYQGRWYEQYRDR